MIRAAILMVLLALLVGCASTPDAADDHPRAATEWSRIRTELALRNAQAAARAGDLPSARRELIQAADRGATDARIHVLLARIAIEEGHFAEADAALDQAATLDPTLPAVPLTRGLILEIRGAWGAAASTYAQAATRFPDNEGLRIAQLRALQATGEDRATEAVLLERGGAEAQSPDMLVVLGQRALTDGRPLAARTYFERALRSDSEAPAAWQGRVKALYALGEHDAVVSALRGRVAEADDGPMRLLLARSALVTGSFDVAVRMLQGHVQQHGDDADAWLDLARAYFLLDRPREVGEALSEALRLQPTMGPALVLRGHLAYREGRWHDALLHYERAVAAAGPVDRLQVERLIAQVRTRVASAAARGPRPTFRAPAPVAGKALAVASPPEVRTEPLAAVNGIDWAYHADGARR